MDAGSFTHEDDFFRAVSRSGARGLLIGRQALIALGLPVMTGDFDLWVHIDDIDRLNQALEPLDLVPSRTPQEARAKGRYVLENDIHVDVLVARAVPTVDGVSVSFEEIWPRRQAVEVAHGVSIFLPSLEDLIATKRFGARVKDVEDIRMLERLKARKSETAP